MRRSVQTQNSHFFLWCHKIMSIWSEKIMDIGLNFIDIRFLIFTKVKDAWECKLIITLILCSHLYFLWYHFILEIPSCMAPYPWIVPRNTYLSINFIKTYLGKRSNMFTFLLVPFALLRQKGRGLSRQGNPFSSTVFHLRESLSAEFKALSSR